MIRLSPNLPKDQRAWRNEKALRLWTRQSELLTAADQEVWLERQGKDDSIEMFGILGEEGDFVGTAGLTSIRRRDRTAEFSLFIATPFQGRGYGTTALESLLDYGFSVLNLRRIWGETFIYPNTAKAFLDKEGAKYLETNEGLINPAWTTFQRIGFEKEGRLIHRYYKFGYYVDCFIFSIGRKPWSTYLLQGSQPQLALQSH